MDPPAAQGRPPEDRGLSFLLDTDTCSAYIKGNPLVFNRFVQYGGGLAISTVILGELFTWAFRAQAPPSRMQDVQDLLKLVSVLDITPDIGKRFGEIRAALLDAGTPGPELDLLNAATALVHKLTLVTHNVQDYANVPGLTMIDDWLVPLT
jgi:tRNA(fMet)-specific endonuclease VapC